MTDIYEQQVLDNLAMFVHDPNSTPFFMYPTTGGQDVIDGVDARNATGWNRNGFSSDLLTLGGVREMKAAWVMTPVHDVRRLELMRCAYQESLVAGGIHSVSSGCPDCKKLQKKFYLGSLKLEYSEGNDTLSGYSIKTGRTTPACFEPVCWLGYGDKSCVPKHCDCLKVGEYCGTYVWILPGGQDQLTKLTFTILDYALTPEASPGTKHFTIYYDENGHQISNRSDATFIEEFDAPGTTKVSELIADSKVRELSRELKQEKEREEALLEKIDWFDGFPEPKDPMKQPDDEEQDIEGMIGKAIDKRQERIRSIQDQLDKAQRIERLPSTETPPIRSPQQGPFNYQPLELQLYQDLLTPR